ncbi:alpha/beta hydrolase [Liquorilactobacillus satsumensis]|uniref:alpha/beta hydrolase n=1 Tax=Liquorilactobacillus satsumensis TaxID=259059 RepID=UPI001E3D4CF8|nr:alpha/beta hydrolase [Liquorilactobacillus satsumensis]MCC7665806.1 hypothetical protein [Liquorilactobacillus satsumensis]MCP9313349.1 alpha/beta hydrolase [Liquorilactobacillus satsumensis]MCP9328180.1 alpha/beta hydrolase [Liquorilactobacillus satsumensis]MCP9356399.1 alpha/beta hydrolase [Liquorilactobacillus satsumensis]MCP9360540.1 alpha/beta hydrolase [Liquorilactobacillus satsumensis]
MNKKFDEPLLFIHGYAGNFFSFDRMIRFFKQKQLCSKRTLVFINSRGKSWIWGKKIRTGVAVQVIFLRNHASVTQQSAWLKELLFKLKNEDNIQHLSIVAHSMGAVSVLHLLTTCAQDPCLPQVRKIVCLGAPFNDLEPGRDTKEVERIPVSHLGPLYPTNLFAQMRRGAVNISRTTQFLNIIGDIDDGFSDGKVAVSSARMLRFLLKKGNFYRELVFEGKMAAHQRLHRNNAVFAAIAAFLLK